MPRNAVRGPREADHRLAQTERLDRRGPRLRQNDIGGIDNVAKRLPHDVNRNVADQSVVLDIETSGACQRLRPDVGRERKENVRLGVFRQTTDRLDL